MRHAWDIHRAAGSETGTDRAARRHLPARFAVQRERRLFETSSGRPRRHVLASPTREVGVQESRQLGHEERVVEHLGMLGGGFVKDRVNDSAREAAARSTSGTFSRGTVERARLRLVEDAQDRVGGPNFMEISQPSLSENGRNRDVAQSAQGDGLVVFGSHAHSAR